MKVIADRVLKTQIFYKMDDLLSLFIVGALALMALVALIKAETFAGIITAFVLIVVTTYITIYVY